MKTTTAFIICCLCSLAAAALKTVNVGDFIYPPSAIFNPGTTSMHYMLYDSKVQPSYLSHSMANGKGIQIKYADASEARRVPTGVLLIKNTDGTYRSVDLPFNCTNYFGSATFNGEVFVCGSKIFTLGPGDSIQNLQDLPSSINTIVFVNRTVFAEISYLGYYGLNIWSNISGNTPSWTLVGSGVQVMRTDYRPQMYPNHAIASDRLGSTLQLIQRVDLNWNLVETVYVNITGEEINPPPVLWNGGDTIIAGWRAEEIGVNTTKGRIKIFRKVNESWSLSKVITSTDLGLAAPGGLGVRLLLIDENTVLVHAVDGYNRTRALTGGSSFALEKINNDWVITTKFVQQNNNDAYLLGAMSYDKSDGRLYFTACRTAFKGGFNGRLSGRECGIKYAVWNRA